MLSERTRVVDGQRENEVLESACTVFCLFGVDKKLTHHSSGGTVTHSDYVRPQIFFRRRLPHRSHQSEPEEMVPIS